MFARDKAKIKGVTPYCLRHTVATKLVNELGIDIVTAGRILGHSKVEMTLRYCHPPKGTVQKAASVLGDFWSIISSKETDELPQSDSLSHSSVYN